MERGKFISFDGLDKAGKSTQVEMLRNKLEEQGIEVLTTREPGGTKYGEEWRIALKQGRLNPHTEVLLMAAARSEHITTKIEPALNEGKWVISDRFADSTFAYQGAGRGIDMQWIEAVLDPIHSELMPDMTFYMRKPGFVSSAGDDAFESSGEDFFKRVEAAYEEYADTYKDRIVTIDPLCAGQRKSEEVVLDEIFSLVKERFLSNSHSR